jgi:hypothetical protein
MVHDHEQWASTRQADVLYVLAGARRRERLTQFAKAGAIGVIIG